MHVWAYGPARRSKFPSAYDRIKHELQDAYYERSEFNICRVIKGKELPGDAAQLNVYTRSGETWHRWIAANIVRQDEEPSIYAYYQTFDVNGVQFTRRGFCAMVELEDYSTGKVQGSRAHARRAEAGSLQAALNHRHSLRPDLPALPRRQ